MNYPRVLIVGETFRSNGGGGITMTNLFKEWPKEKIAVLTDRIHETDPDTGYLYYQLGSKEIQLPFPFYLGQKPIESGVYVFRKNAGQGDSGNRQNSGNRKLKGLIFSSFNYLLQISGLFTFFYQIRLGPELRKWISDFNPEVIYVQPFHHRIMRFGNLLYSELRIPYAIHIMDDSVNYINKSLIFTRFWQKQIVRDFKLLIGNASVCMCISEAMSAEYNKRYGKIFLPFRNPVEPGPWLEYQKKDLKTGNDCLKILYTGRLYSPTYSTLIDLCRVVDKVNRSQRKVVLDIFSLDRNDAFFQNIKGLKGVNIREAVNIRDMPRTISQYDVFFLCLDFDEDAKKYAQFSISTRTSEGMISSVPILMYGPGYSAQYKYLEQTGSGYTVGERNLYLLEQALLKLWDDFDLRQKLGRNAVKYALIDSSADNVRQKFRDALSAVERP